MQFGNNDIGNQLEPPKSVQQMQKIGTSKSKIFDYAKSQNQSALHCYMPQMDLKQSSNSHNASNEFEVSNYKVQEPMNAEEQQLYTSLPKSKNGNNCMVGYGQESVNKVKSTTKKMKKPKVSTQSNGQINITTMKWVDGKICKYHNMKNSSGTEGEVEESETDQLEDYYVHWDINFGGQPIQQEESSHFELSEWSKVSELKEVPQSSQSLEIAQEVINSLIEILECENFNQQIYLRDFETGIFDWGTTDISLSNGIRKFQQNHDLESSDSCISNVDSQEELIYESEKLQIEEIPNESFYVVGSVFDWIYDLSVDLILDKLEPFEMELKDVDNMIKKLEKVIIF